jgi:hypothetical protein
MRGAPSGRQQSGIGKIWFSNTFDVGGSMTRTPAPWMAPGSSRCSHRASSGDARRTDQQVRPQQVPNGLGADCRQVMPTVWQVQLAAQVAACVQPHVFAQVFPPPQSEAPHVPTQLISSVSQFGGLVSSPHANGSVTWAFTVPRAEAS